MAAAVAAAHAASGAAQPDAAAAAAAAAAGAGGDVRMRDPQVRAARTRAGQLDEKPRGSTDSKRHSRWCGLPLSSPFSAWLPQEEAKRPAQGLAGEPAEESGEPSRMQDCGATCNVWPLPAASAPGRLPAATAFPTSLHWPSPALCLPGWLQCRRRTPHGCGWPQAAPPVRCRPAGVRWLSALAAAACCASVCPPAAAPGRCAFCTTFQLVCAMLTCTRPCCLPRPAARTRAPAPPRASAAAGAAARGLRRSTRRGSRARQPRRLPA